MRRIGPVVDTPTQLFELRDKCVKATYTSGSDPIELHSLAEELDLARIDERLD